MSRLRLLERLNRREHEQQRRGRDDRETVRQSVRNHICRILATRAGNVPIDPAFGLAPIGHGGTGGEGGSSGDAVTDAVRELIERYEPRVEEVQVTSRGLGVERLGLALDISMQVRGDAQRRTVRLAGTLSMGGLFVTTWS